MKKIMLAMIAAVLMGGCRTNGDKPDRPAGWPNESLWHHGGLQR